MARRHRERATIDAMDTRRSWQERLDHFAGRGGFLTSSLDVEELLAPLVERIDALEREVEHLRSRIGDANDAE